MIRVCSASNAATADTDYFGRQSSTRSRISVGVVGRRSERLFPGNAAQTQGKPPSVRAAIVCTMLKFFLLTPVESTATIGIRLALYKFTPLSAKAYLRTFLGSALPQPRVHWPGMSEALGRQLET